MKPLDLPIIAGTRLSALFLTLMMIGCQANSQLPKGFNEACYANGRVKLSEFATIYNAELNVQSTSLPQLRKTLEKLGEKYDLRTYDDSALVKRDFGNPEGFTMYLCSKDGLFLTVDDRAWLSLYADHPTSSFEIPATPVLSIEVTAYRNDKKWRSFSNDLDSTIRSAWPTRLRIVDPHTFDHSFIFPTTRRAGK